MAIPRAGPYIRGGQPTKWDNNLVFNSDEPGIIYSVVFSNTRPEKLPPGYLPGLNPTTPQAATYYWPGKGEPPWPGTGSKPPDTPTGITPELEQQLLQESLAIKPPETSFLQRNLKVILIGGGALFFGIIILMLMVKV